MLPKQYRLAGHRIPELIKSGKRVSNRLASFIYQLTTDLPRRQAGNLPARNAPHSDAGGQPITITVIVPMRLSKKAVERNRTRRLFREAIHQHLVHLERGYEVIVMAKKILKYEKLQDIAPDIQNLLIKARLLKN